MLYRNLARIIKSEGFEVREAADLKSDYKKLVTTTLILFCIMLNCQTKMAMIF